ncbi:MAG TPA: hypothetical protein VF521_19035, partial [Pyrinomonadaceae bacterium]
MNDELKGEPSSVHPSSFPFPDSLQSGRAVAAAASPPAFASGAMSEGVEVIINAAAGGGDEDEVRARAVREAFSACGVGARVSVVREGEEVGEYVRRAL